jgi:hypothetical protein
MSFTPSDLVLLKLFKQGMAEIRANPWVLDFIFERLIEDNMDLQASYGEKEIDRAKKWFLKNNIDVRLAYNLDGIQFPCISIELLSQSESKPHATLGDVAAPVWDEDVDQSKYVIKPRSLVGPFPSVNYNVTTGEVTLPSGYDTQLIFKNQALYSPNSKVEYVISSINLNTTNSFYIDEDVRDDFTGAFITPAYQTLKVRREIALFQEQYNFKIMVQGDPGQLIWLHTITAYLILKFRKSLLEKKNIFLTTISSGPMFQEQQEQYGGEVVYSREISMEGMCEVTWVSDILQKFEGVIFTLDSEPLGET